MRVDQDGNDHKDAWNGTPGALKSGDHTHSSGQIRTVVDFHGTALTVKLRKLVCSPQRASTARPCVSHSSPIELAIG